MTRILSGIQPTGDVHLGNFLGAIKRWVESTTPMATHETKLDPCDSIYCVVDLHALTVYRDPAELRVKTFSLIQLLLAAGLDPDRCLLFVQSHVAAHTQLGWLMECMASFGELSRMVQFKEKSARAELGGEGFISSGLFTYPALQASDILLYDTEAVPVGDDQRQHIELCRDLATRFNSRYGDTFVLPEHVIPAVGARIMDLQNPTSKMSKSIDSPQGCIELLEDFKSIEKKIKRAVTDTDNEVAYDPHNKPGVSNLLEILGACTGANPTDLAGQYTQYGPLKADCAAAVIEMLTPIQQRYHELTEHPDHVRSALTTGAQRAEEIASKTLERAYRAVGLL